MKHFYECAQDSELGKKISDFWAKCMRCEEAAERYAKSMGAVTYYEDPQYFAGGCLCVAFAEDVKVDKGMWREAGREQEGGTPYYVPDVESRIGYEEIPHRDYALKDTYCRIYKRDSILQKDGKLVVPYIEFYRDEEPISTNMLPRVASRGLRKAIKAEVKRRKLPVMTVGRLFAILGADVSETIKNPTTPTFFPHQSKYFIGCDYVCTASDLEEITPQIYRMNCDKHEREERRKA